MLSRFTESYLDTLAIIPGITEVASDPELPNTARQETNVREFAITDLIPMILKDTSIQISSRNYNAGDLRLSLKNNCYLVYKLPD